MEQGVDQFIIHVLDRLDDMGTDLRLESAKTMRLVTNHTQQTERVLGNHIEQSGNNSEVVGQIQAECVGCLNGGQGDRRVS